MDLKFHVEHRCTETEARAGRYQAAHGEVATPVFMPVGTAATVKALAPDELEDMGASIILGNTYHLAVRPGIDGLRALGGMHQMAGWRRAILTDSGGFQVLSLAKLRTINEHGVRFRNHLDGAYLDLTPEHAIEIQEAIGSDIMMCLDHLPPTSAPRAEVETAMERTTRWASRCLAARTRPEAALFAIVQGGLDPELRTRHVEALGAIEIGGQSFDGFAIGGLSVGESMPQMYEALAHTAPQLPADKPRYLMGVGRPVDLVEGVARGVDMFDCVMPTRNARKGGLFVDGGRRAISLKNARFKHERGPIDPDCTCYTCARFGAGYLRHLLFAGEILAHRLLSVHNVHVYLDLMRRIRRSLRAGTFATFRREWKAGLDSPPPV